MSETQHVSSASLAAEIREWAAEYYCEDQLDGLEPEFESFAEAGLLTNDEGLVVRFPSGDEFQVTICRSAHAPRSDSDEAETP